MRFASQINGNHLKTKEMMMFSSLLSYGNNRQCKNLLDINAELGTTYFIPRKFINLTQGNF